MTSTLKRGCGAISTWVDDSKLGEEPVFHTRNFRARAIIALAAAAVTGIRMQTARSVELCLWGTELALGRAPRCKSIARCTAIRSVYPTGHDSLGEFNNVIERTRLLRGSELALVASDSSFRKNHWSLVILSRLLSGSSWNHLLRAVLELICKGRLINF